MAADIAQLRMCDLQLGALIADDSPVFRPVELERFARFEGQGHERSAPCRLEFPLPICLPFPGKGCNTAIGTIIAEAHQVGMELF